MSGFSAAVKLGDLDDFLSPAVDCVILPAKAAEPEKKAGSVIKSKSKETDTVASIALSDCLACSGCVTSAETVLLQSQSVDELISKSKDSSTAIYFSISSASRRALSEYFQIPPNRVCRFLESKLVSILSPSLVVVLDTSVAESIVVEETMREMKNRGEVMITSHCPGWTCYATKVLDDSVLSRISRVKAPEQLMGFVVKRLIPLLVSRNETFFSTTRPIVSRAMTKKIRRRKIFHIVVSPCFDKKLEIIRPDYNVGDDSCKAVDLALATTELIDLLTRSPSSVKPFKKSKSDIYDIFSLRDSWASAPSACESGGYAQAATGTVSVLDWTLSSIKNKDMLEWGRSLRSHGFRNIQNVTRRLSGGKLNKFDIVELMACPGGCPRGGGQPVVSDDIDKKENRSFFQRLFQIPTVVDPHSVDHTCAGSEYLPGQVLRDSISNIFGSTFLQEFLLTEWKPIGQPSAENGIHPSSVKW